jgi:hypothetical protein
MPQNIQRYVRSCIVCQETKLWVGKNSNPLNPLPVLGALWEAISWDLIGPLPKSRTFNAIITIIDVQTKAIKLELANITISAMGATVVMRDRVYREEGLPAKVYSNRGPQFVSKFMKELYKLVGVEGNLSTVYHPQTNGQREWINRKVEKYLQMTIKDLKSILCQYGLHVTGNQTTLITHLSDFALNLSSWTVYAILFGLRLNC